MAALGTLAVFPAGTTQARDAESDLLPAPQRADQALKVLGGLTAEAAARNDQSVAELRDQALDKTAWLDKKGELFFVDPASRDTTTSAAAPLVPAAAAPMPYNQTFLLHSKASATRKLYLDFNGEVISGTGWNASYNSNASFTAGAYDSNGAPGSFSNAEMDEIQAVWQEVSEDYAPFDIDVTTEDPGYAGINRANTGDVAFGTRVLVTSTPTIATNCGCGGIGYVGSIDSVGAMHDYYQPAFVFTRGVGNGAKNIGEAASHEAGHNLGLSHDGTASVGYYSGHNAWAPIMGVGYSRPVTQWSKGEYSGANNTEDDFAVAVAHNIPLRADDYGSLSTPSSLSSSPVSLSGVIHSAADQDVFLLAAASGTVTFTATAAPFANLDIKLQLINAAGTVVASNDPAVAALAANSATGMSATLTTTVTTGDYRVVVEGVGFGTASTGFTEYASVGQYTLTGTYTPFSVGPTTTAPGAVRTLRVVSTTPSVMQAGVRHRGLLLVHVTDGNSVDISGVRVTATVSGADNRVVTAVVRAGYVRLSTAFVSGGSGTFTFTITSVTKVGYQLDTDNSVAMAKAATF